LEIIMRRYERASEKGADAIMAGSWKMRLSPLAPRCCNLHLIHKFLFECPLPW
jgi:hypothetical protein